jgi:hypothetical protein
METATAPGWLAEGVEINSRYRLGRRISESGQQAVYETIFRGTDAAIRIFTCETQKQAVAMLSGFVLASQLPHPGLLAIYDFGQDDLYAWIVMERGEECLADILRERTLNEEEARQMLDGIIPALEFLHDRHFAPAQLRPGNVFACGNQVKLSGDRIVAASAEHDIAEFSLLVLQTLTGSTDAAGVGSLPAPFGDIVRGQWDLARTKRALAGEFDSVAGEPQVPTSLSSEIRGTEVPVATHPKYRKYAGLAVGGALAAAALCALLVRGAHHQTAAAPSANQGQAQNVQIVTAAEPAPPRGPEPSVASPVSASPVGASPVAPAGWAIVGASFNREADAQKRAADLRKGHPRLDPKVYLSTGGAAGSTRFVVLFAAGLTEAQAKKQLPRTKRAGAPRGSYALRFQ